MNRFIQAVSLFWATFLLSVAGAGAATQPPADWASLVSAAQKEGNVFIVGETLTPARDALIQAFRAKYGISADIMDGRGSEQVAKIMAERQAGLYQRDVGLMGISTVVIEIKPKGITTPLEAILSLPEVRDGSRWRGGQLPFIDKEHHALALAAMAVPCMVINTDLVQASDIRQHTDLLQPKWKGKITMTDASTSGSGNNWFTHVVTNIYGQEKGLQFMRSLARQDIMMTRDPRLQIEWVARGKYPVGLGFSMALTSSFKKAGAPLGFPALTEPSFLSGGSGNLFVFDRAPHPNAAKLFVNWLLSQEGSKVFAPSMGYPSLRLDVPSDFVEASLVPPPNVTFRGQDDYVLSRDRMRKLAAEIFK